MASLSLHLARSLPAPVAGNRGLHSKSQLFSPIEVCVLLIALAIALCISVCVPIAGQYQGRNEQAMLSAMLAAGGMPLLFAPPALCRAGKQQLRFDQSEMNALLRN
jgi:hypothetical protein